MLPYQELEAEQMLPGQISVSISSRPDAGILVDQHWHLCSELLFGLNGRSVQTLNGEAFSFHAGETLYIAPGAVHAVSACEKGCSIGVLMFYQSSILPSLLLPSEGDFESVHPLFDRILKESRQQLPGHDSMIRGLLFQILGLLERSGKEVGQLPPDPGEAGKIAGYLRSHLSERITLAQAAEAAGYSPTYFSRRFRQWMGMPFKAYMDELRIHAAKGMLSDGMSAAAVAEVLKYDTPSSFSRAFRRLTGQTPSGYQAGQKRQELDRNA